MAALGVVDVTELVELVLQLSKIIGDGLFGEPFLQGLLEPFDFASGLRVIGTSCHWLDAGITQFCFEHHLEPAELAGETQSVV